ncbi:DUF423 domain-containing protein [Marinilongibacter aquaticus]|uniref:DUF423 domain-containing protein n=1 Tax=Marinilongibacter aquaticus TaxID=2975157 RepID=UPI0021BDBF51|nr:DUF423 domain-containing protein [Marinilongibacter aquaticus]UBM57928.1 DUF423 domain-containing protein [Marinilongibacter aquaticus]
MNKLFLKSAAVLGLLAVALGAFGAHALHDFLLNQGVSDTFETAVKYQFYHALALLAVGILSEKFQHKWIRFSGYSFLIGSVIFCLSLYAICFSGIKMFGAVAPIGGLAFIFGWLFLFLAVLKD